ncbi:MAG: hypothetical protein QM817_27950 [Archangium sp.]
MRQLCLVMIGLTGCSLVRTRGPSADYLPDAGDPICSRSLGPPIVDTVFGAGSAVLIVAGILAATTSTFTAAQRTGLTTSSVATVGTGIVGVGLFGTSAVTGYLKVDACEDAWKQRVEALERLRIAPPVAPPAVMPPPAFEPPR